jgi:hypothetical protein
MIRKVSIKKMGDTETADPFYVGLVELRGIEPLTS